MRRPRTVRPPESLAALLVPSRADHPEVWSGITGRGRRRCPIVDTWWQTETGGIDFAAACATSESGSHAADARVRPACRRPWPTSASARPTAISGSSQLRAICPGVRRPAGSYTTHAFPRKYVTATARAGLEDCYGDHGPLRYVSTSPSTIVRRFESALVRFDVAAACPSASSHDIKARASTPTLKSAWLRPVHEMANSPWCGRDRPTQPYHIVVAGLSEDPVPQYHRRILRKTPPRARQARHFDPRYPPSSPSRR